MIRKLHFKCPDCNHKLASVPGMDIAIQVVARTCPRCKARFQVKIVPHVRNDAAVDVGTLVKIN